MNKSAYSIRHRWLSVGGEWQVIHGKKVVFRCDLEDQAKDWIEKHRHETNPKPAPPVRR